MAEAKIKSEGKCVFCNKTFSRTGINRHLKTHLDEKTAENNAGASYLLKIDANPYFLSLWVDGETTLKKIDQFLRAIWLECCGHMSAFSNPVARRQGGGLWDFFEAENLLKAGKTKQYENLMEETAGEIPMSRKAKNVFYPDLKLEYEYDFGSTTDLLVTVIAEYPYKASKPILLLSRNEPLQIMCDTCKKEPATEMCLAHEWDEASLFCPKCVKKHTKECDDFEDYVTPVVNSPRMGICAYDGGTIDKERDGVFKG